MARLVDDVRTLEKAIGHGRKVRLECEMPAYRFARRSIVTARDLPKGTRLTDDDLVMKRPGTGLSPEYLDRVRDRVTVRDIPADTLLSLDDLEG